MTSRHLFYSVPKLNRLIFNTRTTLLINKRSYSSKGESELPKNLLEDFYTASRQTENGVIYDKKPFKMRLSPEKTYMWCLCGHSKNQPLCDGSHKNPYLKIKQRPIKFQVDEEKDYWLCNCKQTSHRPFCDGTHKRDDIQALKK
ncbi:CDGSH iron-sulfur domain-containing protein 3, mitochondrial [Cimex lectularius]|uniref:Iron-binding zinc finger CDGSH type domain-containing protein n=1 Tax=Cimex lectularius TaxID=79782 RepID=A0A8I6S2S3_CIMLE|nr:CDGSH iron-sulfur domain-containing protein 3, mitochondrial [Cimex lectularius]